MELKDWIESEERDYGIGLAILGNHCKNRILLQNLGRKKNPEKLEYELGKVATAQGIEWKYLGKVEETTGGDIQEPLPQVEETEGKEQVSTESHSDQVIDQMNSQRVIVIDALPAYLKAKWHQNQDGYKEIRSLHEKLKLMEKAAPEDRQPLTERIAALDDLIRDNWKEIDAFVPTVPSAEIAPVIDHKRMQANRKYISTNLKKLPGITDTVKKAKIVGELQLRFNEIKTAGETFAAETLEELGKVGVEC